MRKNGKRAAALGMAAVMAAAALSGCQKGNGGPAGGTDRAGGDTTAAVTEAQASGDNKLVVAIQTNSYVTDYDNNYFTKYLEDKLGIEIEFYQLPAATDEVRTKVSLMATSNDNLPDVLIVDNALTPETILEYGSLALDKDGKTVIAPFTTEGWKAGLTYMNDLYNEGLLSPAIFTDDDTQFKATLNEETNVVGLVSFGSLSNYPDAANNSNYLEMEILNPVKGPDGTNYTPYTEYSPNQEFFIFNGCKNVDLAVKLADAFYDHEASTVARFGEKGVDYTEDPAELEKMNNAYVAAGLYDKVTLAYISNYWLEPAAKTWHGVSPRYASLAEMNTVANGMVTYNPEDKTQLNAKSYEYYFDKHPEKVLPLLHYTEDEAGQIQEALSNIPTYVNQTMAEFITGARDIESGWDAYMSELKGMGLDEWQKSAQAAYDRSVE